jgi:cytochrome c oxidase subunit 4
MKDLLSTRTTAVWAVLVAATLISFSLGHGGGTSPARALSPAILLIAFVKVWFVVFEFMEVRHAPTWLRIALQGWMVVCCATLMALAVR